MSLTVIGVGLSPFVRKVRAFLGEKSVGYEHEPLPPFGLPPEFTKISPLRKIPVLRDGDRTLPDSSIICAYLERKHPNPPLYPDDDFDYARALWIEEYADTGLLNAGIPIFVERVVNKIFMNKEPDEARVAQAIDEDLPVRLDYLEGELGDAEFLVGNRFSIADIAVSSPFVNLDHAGYQVDAGRWPKLAAYVERVHSRPSFKALIEEDRKALPGS